MGPHAQLSGGHGRCGPLRHVNASVLPPEGHELFVERGSPLAGLLTLSLGLGAPTVSLRPSLLDKRSLRHLHQPKVHPVSNVNFRVGRGVPLADPSALSPSCSCSRAQKM